MYLAKDDNGNAIKSSEYSSAENFKVSTDDMMPTVYGGLGTTFEAYGFDASIQLSYQLGGKIYDTGYRRLMHGGQAVQDGTGIKTYTTPGHRRIRLPISLV